MCTSKILGTILAVMSISRDTDLVKVVSRQLEVSSRELTGAMILATKGIVLAIHHFLKDAG